MPQLYTTSLSRHLETSGLIREYQSFFFITQRIKGCFEISVMPRDLKFDKNQKCLFYKAAQIIQNGLLGIFLNKKCVPIADTLLDLEVRLPDTNIKPN